VKVILFGATGMVGQGVLRECLLDADVESVLTVGRSPTGQQHAKLRELVHGNFTDFSAIESELTGYDACFFCLGVSSVGMDAERYRYLTYDITMAAARILARLNPRMIFIYVTGRGTDSTEQGSLMWARVKGKTENDLIALPGLRVRGYAFRPGAIQPLHGAKSKTRLYRTAYVVVGPLLGLARRLFPRQITTTEQIGLAMLSVARSRPEKRVLESADIVAAGSDKSPT
jgi:nucleoside-diphosphate-sugar epimerase